MSNCDHPYMIKQSLFMMVVISIVGGVGLIAMMHWPFITSVSLIVLLVLFLAGGRS